MERRLMRGCWRGGQGGGGGGGGGGGRGEGGEGSGGREWAEGEVIYNYLGQFDRVLKAGGKLRAAQEYGGATLGDGERREHLLEISCQIGEGRLEAVWRYSEGIHRRETIEKLAERFEEVVRGIIKKSRSGA